MSDQIKITAEQRTEFGKGAARRIRRTDKIPAVLYGRGTEPEHLTLPGHATMMALKIQNAVLTLDVEGEERLALAKDVQRDPIKRTIEHVDLVLIKKGERVVVDIAIHVEGDAAPDTFVNLEYPHISVETEATHIPESFTVSVEGKEPGFQILAGGVELPEGVTLVTDPEELIVHVSKSISEEALEAELAEAEAEAGIEHEESDEEAAAEGEGEAAVEGGDEDKSEE
ncbi:50S ribosomal protein L25/general stress protein Ctc [Ornithinimicrobium avium]|uniref:Large ribosomal subunit protein bL25 n=1 Tax=Ornithinimicrobium avium TaxID=2283195 RepID=A0A345NQJ1_9MICO|nr:50S ribosomal protein L25/general stress protein Ctc [Ornithinimicrobium avium]AXH97299.1 50S ribosomal protein L25/general stress protein Ctc [Ornithinimicrobium avium]